MPSHCHLESAPVHAARGRSEPAAIRVVLAEDHVTMRRSLRQLLDSERGIDVVAECGELSAALSQVALLHPDVLVLDLRLPEGSSFDVVKRLVEQTPHTRIVVITMHESHAFARAAHHAGALGFVLKDTADAELPDAVRAAAQGRRYTSPRVTAPVVRLRRI